MIHMMQHVHMRLYIAIFVAFLYSGFYNADGFLFQPIFHIPLATWIVALFIFIFYRRIASELRAIKRKMDRVSDAQPLSNKLKFALTFSLLFFTHIVVYAYFFQHAQSFGPMYPYFCTATGMYAAFFAYIYHAAK